MARNLNLKPTPTGNGGIKVSWTDVAKRPNPSIVVMLVYSIFAVVGILLPLTTGFVGFVIWFGVTLGFPILMKMKVEESNSITFERDVTTHKGQTFPTSDISRIEYGSEKELTGAITKTAFQMENEEPQTLIRFWVDDNYSHNISLNTWQNQVNHEIRDTLAKALDAVRKVEKEKEHEAEHGKKGDFGVPEY